MDRKVDSYFREKGKLVLIIIAMLVLAMGARRSFRTLATRVEVQKFSLEQSISPLMVEVIVQLVFLKSQT